MNHSRRTSKVLVIVLTVLALDISSAQAKKPDNPGGGNGGGEIDGYVFVNTSEREIWKVELPSGNKSFVGPTSELFYDVAISPDGFLYGLDWIAPTLYRVDADTADTVAIGELGYGDPGGLNSMDFDSNGDLYVARNRLLNVDPLTATSTVIGDTGFEATGDLAISQDGSFFLSAFGADGIDDLVSLDPVTGVGTLVGSIGFSNVYGMDFVGDTLYGITKDKRIITVDPVTGTGTQVRKLGVRGSVYGMAAVPAMSFSGLVSVPEPSTAMIALIGFSTLFGGSRRLRDFRKNSEHA